MRTDERICESQNESSSYGTSIIRRPESRVVAAWRTQPIEIRQQETTGKQRHESNNINRKQAETTNYATLCRDEYS